MNWTIVPYVSVGPLKFGMTPKEVAEHLGPPENVSNAMPAGASEELKQAYADFTIEFRVGREAGEQKPTVHYEAGRAVAFDLFDTLTTTEIDGYRLFEHAKAEAMAKLKHDSVHYAEEFDGYVFFDFGLSISNDDDWAEAPPINVFSRGQFDDLLEEADDNPDVKIFRK